MAYTDWLDDFVGIADDHDDCDDEIVLNVNDNGYDVEFSFYEKKCDGDINRVFVYAYVSYEGKKSYRTRDYAIWHNLTEHLTKRFGIRNLEEELYEALEERGH